MGKRKLEKGDLMTSLDEFFTHEFFLVNGKTFHRGWCISWPLRLTKHYIDRKCVFVGKKKEGVIV